MCAGDARETHAYAGDDPQSAVVLPVIRRVCRDESNENSLSDWESPDRVGGCGQHGNWGSYRHELGPPLDPAAYELVSPEGLEPSTPRLKGTGSALQMISPQFGKFSALVQEIRPQIGALNLAADLVVQRPFSLQETLRMNLRDPVHE